MSQNVMVRRTGACSVTVWTLWECRIVVVWRATSSTSVVHCYIVIAEGVVWPSNNTARHSKSSANDHLLPGIRCHQSCGVVSQLTITYYQGHGVLISYETPAPSDTGVRKFKTSDSNSGLKNAVSDSAPKIRLQLWLQCSPINIYFAWCDITVLSEAISMKLALKWHRDRTHLR